MVKRLMAGCQPDRESLALEMIDRVGPTGHFMEEAHTLENFRSATWHPALFDRQALEPWQQRQTDVVRAARCRADALLDEST